MRTEPLVTCQRVSRTFGSGHRAVVAVHDVTCLVEPGARIAVVGQSGSGKSTMIHLLAGLDEPTDGVVQWNPELVRRQALDVGVVFQGPSLIPALTAQENVALPLVLQGAHHQDAQASALAAMHRVGIAAVANQLPEELSGGQEQRVAVARVLVTRPRLILADEPTGRLDQGSAQRVVDVLTQAADEVGAALLVATHDPQVAQRLTTRWRMSDGRLSVYHEDAGSEGEAR